METQPVPVFLKQYPFEKLNYTTKLVMGLQVSAKITRIL